MNDIDSGWYRVVKKYSLTHNQESSFIGFIHVKGKERTASFEELEVLYRGWKKAIKYIGELHGESTE